MDRGLDRRQILAAGLTAVLPMRSLAGTVERALFRVYRNVIVVDVTLDSHGPYPFMPTLTTSANAIQQDLAKNLGLLRAHQVRNFLLNNQASSPLGKGRETDYAAGAVRVGEHDMGAQFFVGAPMQAEERDENSRHGADADFPRGIIGSNLLLKTPCVMDYARSEIRFHSDGVPGLADFSLAPFSGKNTGADGGVCVNAMLDGTQLTCLLDTCGRAEVFLASKYVRQHHLYDHAKDYIEEPRDPDVPENGNMRTVRMKNFQLGGVHFDEVNVHLSDPAHNDHISDMGVDAIIGRSLLQRLTLAFQDGQVYVRAGGNFMPVSAIYTPPSDP